MGSRARAFWFAGIVNICFSCFLRLNPVPLESKRCNLQYIRWHLGSEVRGGARPLQITGSVQVHFNPVSPAKFTTNSALIHRSLSDLQIASKSFTGK